MRLINLRLAEGGVFRIDYNNPGSVMVAAKQNFDAYISNPAFGLAPSQQGFEADPDGDGLASGLEAWFGTHPEEPNVGLTHLSTDGTTTIFSHPQNETRPVDVVGFYQWSPNMTDWYAGDGVDGPPGGPAVTFPRKPLEPAPP